MTKMTKEELLYLEAKTAYYEFIPIMSDKEFDELEATLKKLGSTVVNVVGSGLQNDRIKYNHITPMLSLAKISADKENNAPSSDFLKWFQKVGFPDLLEVTPKYDGNAISLQYENGTLKKGLTRGDGVVGQDVTEKIRSLVPNEINLLNTCEIRGEMLMPLDKFNSKYAEEFKNPRNLVAGILSNKVPNFKMINDMNFVPYEVKIIDDNDVSYIEDVLHFFEDNNFQHLPDLQHCQFGVEEEKPIDWKIRVGSREFDAIYKRHLRNRENSKYQLDGIVLKVIDNDVRKELGANSHHPNWAIAVKFLAKATITTITDITWTMGKTGTLTPVAIVDSIDLDGSMVSRCSAHNYKWVIDNKILPGCVVEIAKKGDIIPQIIKVIKESEEYCF